MRLSRPCYDKPRRCPGWAGGGMRWAAVERCAEGAMLHGYPPGWARRFHRCRECRVVVLPWWTRVLDPTWWPGTIRLWRSR